MIHDELRELKIRLQELVDKDFIQPWCHIGEPQFIYEEESRNIKAMH